MKGYLVLEDGTVFEGELFGAVSTSEPISGEVVFNTGMTGYQEVLTDPSYYGQIVTMTYPLIGNYGINPDDFESRQPWVRGFVVKELCDTPSHWQAAQSLSSYLAASGVTGIAGIDTRALTRHLRSAGTLRGVLAGEPAAAGAEAGATGAGPAAACAGLAALARAFACHDHVLQVTAPQPYRIYGNGRRLVVIDYGLKTNILRCLLDADCDLTVVPATWTAEQILTQLKPDGIMLTNGPGDPADAGYAVETVRQLVAHGRVPIFGICLGHQILALALGASTYKLPYGHRGANHPVKDLGSGRVYITSQNHGYAVDERTLPDGVAVTHRNLNDGTVEGLLHRHLPVFSVQYHPEANPGPRESRYLFERFLSLIDRKQIVA
jgi:carbamoyl-phosphate synthase small subunit